MADIAPKNSSNDMRSNALEVVNLPDDYDDDDDDDISVLYASPPSLRRKGTGTSNPISVESYSYDKDLKRAIMESLASSSQGSGSSSTSSGRRRSKRVIDLSRYDSNDNDDVQVIDWSPSKKILKRESSNSNSKQKTAEDNIGSSDDHTFLCDICVDEKPNNALFRVLGCSHSYCSDCMAKYVASKLQENVNNISCPVSGCSGRLEPEHCRSILPSQVFDRWGDVLCESLILASEKFYCPFKDCSALLIDERNLRDEVISQSECPDCRRLFCVECRVPWHPDISCAEFKKLNENERQKEDIMLFNLAKEKKWMRCPRCKFYVEKSSGCLFMRCRCNFTFCYNCGAEISGQLGHYCSKCRR